MPTTIENANGTLSVISDDGRPELTEAQREAARRADRITFSDLLKQFDCDRDRLAEILELPDLAAAYVASQYVGRILVRRENIYSKSALNTALERRRAVLAACPQVVK
jgi:hypothetical protein